jgi:hypothetical protein
MAQFSDYTDLQAAVLAHNWGRNSDQIADFIYLAHQQINLRLRIPAMEKSDPLTIASGTVTVPSDLQAVKRMWIDGVYDTPLTPTTPDLLQSLRASYTANKPQWYAIEGSDDTTDVFQFAPAPSISYTAYLAYYRRLAFFASGAATNKILTRHPHLYLYGALAEASLFADDDARLAKYPGLFDRAIEDLNRQARADQLSGGPLAMQSPYTV